MNQKQ